jgi:hypothetical protein
MRWSVDAPSCAFCVTIEKGEHTAAAWMEIPKKTLNASHRASSLPGGDGAQNSVQLLEKARADTDTVLKELASQLSGLSEAVLRFCQELRADNAAAKLQAMVSNTATLMRGGKEEEVSLKMLVPGDIIRLSDGSVDMDDVAQ